MSNNNKRKKPQFDFDNKVKLSGIITNKDNFVNLIPYPVFGFEIQHPKKLSDEDLIPDPLNPDKIIDTHNIHRAIVFNNEGFINEFELGDQILVEGEIQSRNFSQKHQGVEEEIENAIELYQNLFDSLPVEKEPTQYFRQPILWSKLFEYNLLTEVPSDSAFNAEQELEVTETSPYIYKLDWNGEVSKETEETIYEIVVHNYEKIEDEDFEHVNEVHFQGRIATDLLFDIEGMDPVLRFTAQSYIKYFENEKRYAFIPFLATGDNAESIFNDYRRNLFVDIKGEFISNTFKKQLSLRKKKANGKTKRKKIEIDELRRTIVISEISKQRPK